MPASTLGIGIIGVSPARGWAATAHIRALRALPNYEIRAISAHSAESARAAGEAFAVSAAFSDHEQLRAQPGIDVVAVTVKVPHHRELVCAALAAGKAVYCEWPLGRDVDDARANVVVQANAYMLDTTNAANVLTIAAGHSVDTLNYVLGEFADLSAVADLRRPLITIAETGEQIVKTAPDQIAVIGTGGTSPPNLPSRRR